MGEESRLGISSGRNTLKEYAAPSAGNRQNLMAVWTWRTNLPGFEADPARKIQQFLHDREPQYTPLSEEVLRVLAVASRQEQVILSCCLQTAARRSQIFRWAWNEDTNFQKREVRLGTRKTRDGSMSSDSMPCGPRCQAFRPIFTRCQRRPSRGFGGKGMSSRRSGIFNESTPT